MRLSIFLMKNELNFIQLRNRELDKLRTKFSRFELLLDKRNGVLNDTDATLLKATIFHVASAKSNIETLLAFYEAD